MIELIQTPWSPFCLVQRRILEFSGEKFKLTNLPRNGDRSLIWKLTKENYYVVPIIRDGPRVIFESSEDAQDIARHIDRKFSLGLFPKKSEGVQNILTRFFENEIEALGFKLNDIYYKEFVTKADHVAFIRHKERKFGRGCLAQWRTQQKELLGQLAEKLRPCEQMLAHHEFLLGDRPLFVDFNLLGMVDNFLFTGHYAIPKKLPQLRRWHRELSKLRRKK
jgi:glutathione S-transferase